ncbi:helix-turn-helix transcriptional regulator [Thalassorhabdomicrobium marinisediminis]|nr:helix-turn-helix transcriptional regulator [Thalassorhabdomicrobium marinisediminis]
MILDKDQTVFGQDDVARLYQSALNCGLYDQILDTTAERVPNASVMLFFQDTVDPGGNALMHRGLDPDASRSFSVEISATSAWFNMQWHQPIGAVFQQQDLIDLDQFKATRFYRGWLADRGDVETAISMVIYREGTKQVVLEVRSSQRVIAAEGAQIRKFLTNASTHFCHATDAFNLKRKLKQAQWVYEQILCLNPFPTIIVNPQGRVEHTNLMADELLRSRSCLILGPDRHLNGIEADSDADLMAAIRDCHQDTSCKRRWLHFRSTDRQRDTFLTVVRLSTSAPSRSNHGANDDAPLDRRVAVIANHGSAQLELSHDMLWQTYKLSSHESELASELLKGNSIGDIAYQRQMSKQTVRNHLSNLMRKTGTRRQVELVTSLQKLAMSSPP